MTAAAPTLSTIHVDATVRCAGCGESRRFSGAVGSTAEPLSSIRQFAEVHAACGRRAKP